MLDLPIVTFWMLHKNIDRVLAERDQRALMVAAAAQSAEGVEDLLANLNKQMRQPFVFNDDEIRREPEAQKLDREGLQSLKNLGGALR